MKLLKLAFGNFQLFPDVIIGTLNQGIHYDLDCNHILTSLLVTHYGLDHVVGYISVRENDYSVDPMVHLNNKIFENLACIGIVASNNNALSSVAIESRFFKENKLRAFHTDKEALIWTNNQIALHNTNGI